MGDRDDDNDQKTVSGVGRARENHPKSAQGTWDCSYIRGLSAIMTGFEGTLQNNRDQ
jgi:hypothetical protein